MTKVLSLISAASRAEHEISNHNKTQPLFLYFALPAPHTPWVPTKEFDGVSDVPLYGDFVTQVDATVGRVLDALDAAEMSDNTLVIFSSDNGPVWYVSDEEKYAHQSTSLYRGMKGDAWEGGHRMPFVVRWPKTIAAGTVTNQLACLTDVFSTCAEIVGYTTPDTAGEDSISLLPVLQGEVDNDTRLRKSLIVNSSGDFMTVRQGAWKLIPFRGSGGFSKPKVIRNIPAGEPKGQLYNLDDDPKEANNLYNDRPDIVAKLEGLLEQSRRAGRTK